MVIKVIIFDFDGVLTFPEKMRFSKYFTEKFPKIDLYNFFGECYGNCVVGSDSLEKEVKVFLANKNFDYDDLVDLWKEYNHQYNDEMLSYLEEIKTKFKLVVATEQADVRAKMILDDEKLKSLIQNFFITCDIGIKKSNPIFYKKCFEELIKNMPDLQRNEILFFDDSLKNVQAANEFGFKAYEYIDLNQCKKIINEY